MWVRVPLAAFMLLPHEYTLLTVEEAKELIKYIEISTATKCNDKNYDKMGKAGILDMYDKLRMFVENSKQWEKLRYFDPDEYERAKD